MNLLTFDLEEWFHILDFAIPIRNLDWDSLPPRAELVLDRFLDLLSYRHISCTFFVLGWMAEKHPNLVRKINSFDHEIASHGYGHDLVYSLKPKRFRHDIRRAKMIVEDLTGKEIQGYRAPGYSITPQNMWAFDIIAEEGFLYDASLYPGKHGHGGIPGLPCKPFILLTIGDQQIEEYPVTLMNMFGYRTAFAGGGYFRLFPFWFISRCISHMNNQGIPVMSYLHPRDLDPDTPRLPMSWERKFKCYVNLSHSWAKLEKMLSAHSFGSIKDRRDSVKDSFPLFSLKNSSLK